MQNTSFPLRQSALTVAGVDEVGRGCLAGPVVAAAVILPDGHGIRGLADSKILSPQQREGLNSRIMEQASAWCLGCCWPREIERLNILRASLLAMARAVERLKIKPERLVVDGNQRIPFPLPQECIVDGDAIVPSISAASIVAKVFRDRLMRSLDRRYPGYGFAEHKGYATRKHMERLKRLGPCSQHRMTFRGVRPEREQWLLIP